MIGTRLGSYEITAKLGEGGMGEVYRATDSRLKREVAIKVLPAAFTADPERLSRFEREAQLLAQLNHPNIAQIYGMEASGEAHALVMELVEGPTLAERLEQGPLPFDEGLSISLQIAQALEEAHEKGIVHRDLKPQNVKASIEGKTKVLDFGLAKAMDPASGAGSAAAGDLARSPTLMNSPTLTSAGTQLGVILGTAAYMAPEQARGGAVDKRADIWAFGVVLYEMLSGRSLFAGDTVSDTLAGVLKTEIDFSKLPAETPAAIRRLLRRCLERNPSADDARTGARCRDPRTRGVRRSNRTFPSDDERCLEPGSDGRREIFACEPPPPGARDLTRRFLSLTEVGGDGGTQRVRKVNGRSTETSDGHKRLRIPNAAHGDVNPCIGGIFVQVLQSGGITDVDTSCLATLPADAFPEA